MYRYFALLWNPSDSYAAQEAATLATSLRTSTTSEWRTVLQEDGVLALHAGEGTGASQTRILDGGAGLIFGRIFTRRLGSPAAAQSASFDEPETVRVITEGSRRLLSDYWGRYVALWRNPATREVWVLRDPSGGLPCLLIQHRGVQIVCADLEDCAALGLIRFTVNWAYIAALVVNPGLQSRDTGLQEVSELQAGELLYLPQGGAQSVRRSMEWNPITVASQDPVQDAAVATQELRRITLGCVHAWAACYPAILHNLSGGLDSSIVLSCLHSAPTRPRVSCLTYFASGPGEDERPLARLMASRVGVELVEHPLDAARVRLDELLHVRRASRPWFYIHELEHGRFENDLAARQGARGHFSGAGGDGVFFQARADLAVADYLFDYGVGRGWFRTALDAAELSRKSIWPLLTQAVRIRYLRRRWDPVAGMRPRSSLIDYDAASVRAAGKDFTHPWLTPQMTRGAPPGVLWHAASIGALPSYYSSFVRDTYAERTLPLLSQPLVELCLRTPTYVLIKSGQDRAMARQAFASDLPAEIVRRRAKGRADQHLRNILDSNLNFARELLLDGWLVREGLLKRDALERQLAINPAADFEYTQVLQVHLCTEVWLRRWLG